MLIVLRDLMRTAHVVAAGTWIGGSLFYLVVLTPALRATQASAATSAAVARRFRSVVNACMGTLLLSGMFLVFDRLTSAAATTAYVVVLVVKVALALALFALAIAQAQEARRPAKARGRLWHVAPRAILLGGVVTFLLGAVLTGLFEAGIGLR